MEWSRQRPSSAPSARSSSSLNGRSARPRSRSRGTGSTGAPRRAGSTRRPRRRSVSPPICCAHDRDVAVAAVPHRAVAHHHRVRRERRDVAHDRLVVVRGRRGRRTSARAGAAARRRRGGSARRRCRTYSSTKPDVVGYAPVPIAAWPGGVFEFEIPTNAFGEPGALVHHLAQVRPVVGPLVEHVDAGRVPDQRDDELRQLALVGRQERLVEGAAVGRLVRELHERGRRRRDVDERRVLRRRRPASRSPAPRAGAARAGGGPTARRARARRRRGSGTSAGTAGRR